MKKVYFIDCDCDTRLGQEIVWSINEKYSRGFYTRKEAIAYLKKIYHICKERYKDDIWGITTHNGKQLQLGRWETITLDCRKGIVSDDFDWNDDKRSFFEEAVDTQHLIDSRYLCGRY